MRRNEKPKGILYLYLVMKLSRFMNGIYCRERQRHWLPLVTRLARDCRLDSRDLQTISHRLSHEGINFLTVTLPSLGKALVRGLGDGLFQLPPAFKKAAGRATPAFAGSLFCQIFDCDGRLLDDADETAVADLYQFLMFAYKTDLPYKRKSNNAVVDKFVANEALVASYDFQNDAILEVAAFLAAAVFQDFDPEAITPRHGPGATARFTSQPRKFSERLTPGMPVYSGFGHLFWFNHQDGMDRLERYPVYGHSDYFVRNDVARVVLVPKDSRGPRLISAEPVENQWIQQGLMSYMVKTLQNHPFTRGHVNFDDQSVNKRLAYEHSRRNGAFATLDLKDASDLNSLRLTKYVFGKSEKLLSALIQSRSRSTRLPDGSEITLAKFAPMGSAVCFPVMASTIYFLIVAGLLGRGLTLEQAIESVYVYGDDIVVKNEFASYSIDILHRYGFKVNTEKSFINSRFLESCGWDCFNGYVITPTRLRQDILNLFHGDPKTVASLAASANALAQKGYKQSSRYCFRLLEALLGPLPYGTEKSPYVCRVTSETEIVPELNAFRRGLIWRHESDLQRYPLGSSLIAWVVKSKREVVEKVSGWAHLMRTHSLLGKSEPVPKIGVFDRPRSQVLKRAKFDHYSM